MDLPLYEQPAPERSRSLTEQLYSARYYIIGGILGLLFLNLIAVDIVLLTKKENTQASLSGPSLEVTQRENAQTGCNDACLEAIKQATESVKLELLGETLVTTTPLPTPTLTPTLTPTRTPTPTSSVLREYFIPLGTGFGASIDWTTLTQLGATINPADYGNIQNITFEVSLRIPTGNQTAYVRLYNANTFQTVTGSEVSLSGGTPTILTASPISLPAGDNLYQVQLRTQLGYTTYIDFARIRIQAQ